MAGTHRSGNGMGMGLGEAKGPSHSGCVPLAPQLVLLVLLLLYPPAFSHAISGHGCVLTKGGAGRSGQLGCTITGGSQRYALKLNHCCVIHAPHSPSLGLGVSVEVKSSMLCKEVTLLEISPFLYSASGRGGDLSSRGYQKWGIGQSSGLCHRPVGPRLQGSWAWVTVDCALSPLCDPINID